MSIKEPPALAPPIMRSGTVQAGHLVEPCSALRTYSYLLGGIEDKMAVGSKEERNISVAFKICLRAGDAALCATRSCLADRPCGSKVHPCPTAAWNACPSDSLQGPEEGSCTGTVLREALLPVAKEGTDKPPSCPCLEVTATFEGQMLGQARMCHKYNGSCLMYDTPGLPVSHACLEHQDRTESSLEHACVGAEGGVGGGGQVAGGHCQVRRKLQRGAPGLDLRLTACMNTSIGDYLATLSSCDAVLLSVVCMSQYAPAGMVKLCHSGFQRLHLRLQGIQQRASLVPYLLLSEQLFEPPVHHGCHPCQLLVLTCCRFIATARGQRSGVRETLWTTRSNRFLPCNFARAPPIPNATHLALAQFL